MKQMERPRKGAAIRWTGEFVSLQLQSDGQELFVLDWLRNESQ